MAEYSDQEDDNSEVSIEDTGNQFMVICDDQQFICDHPKLSKVFEKEMKRQNFTVHLNFSVQLTSVVVEFMNCGYLPENDIPLTEIGNAARVLRIPTLIQALIEPMANLLRELTLDQLKEEFKIGTQIDNYDELCLECLWIYDA